MMTAHARAHLGQAGVQTSKVEENAKAKLG